jgi:HD-like signal output (HDOD) protein
VAVTKDPNAGVGQLQEVVESDPALMLRCLRVVNSASHGIRRKVTSLRQAISLLGFRSIRGIALTNSVADVFRADCAVGAYTRLGLWSHVVATAICAELVVQVRSAPDCEDSYAAGLLHDIGIIAADQYANRSFRAMMNQFSDSEDLQTQEQAQFGFDHTVLGTRVAEKWRLPDSIRACIRFHHMPQNYRGEFGTLVNVVAVANWIASASGFTSVGVNAVRRPNAAFDLLGLTHDETDAVAASLLKRVSDGALILFQPAR